MTADTLALWMKSTALHSAIVHSTSVWPILEMLHYLGLSLLFGGLMIIDLRLMSVIRHLSFRGANGFIPGALVGFAINLTTGVLFLFGDPDRYWGNTSFQIKMALITFAGVNALVFRHYLKPSLISRDEPLINDANQTPANKRQLALLAGLLSLCAWIGVIVMGRLIPYLE
ncbi:hypothetical protein [Cobetia sp. L2A1]|uniref:hypothetical protein n=1 Tax=Cobetia sp. L2A1 TaxID=2686360 RepID=UPI00131DA7A8|nr:hypothetical protein [Cobetia sp. L2A1]